MRPTSYISTYGSSYCIYEFLESNNIANSAISFSYVVAYVIAYEESNEDTY
jgi:hypothetical protein